MTTTATTTTALRSLLLNELRRDLVGPHTEDERLHDYPTVEYLTGILYPSGMNLPPEEDEALAINDADNEDDAEVDTVLLARTMNPASIGLSFAIEKTLERLEVKVSYGLYENYGKQEDNNVGEWQRRQITHIVPIVLSSTQRSAKLENNAHLQWVVREYDTTYSVSLFLVNRNQMPDENQPSSFKQLNTLCLFQPGIEVSGTSGTCPFAHRAPEGTLPTDADLESHALLYRDCHEFAVGHSCAVDWDTPQGDHTTKLWTTLIPEYELAATIPNDISGLEMKALSDVKTAEEVSTILQPLLDAYEQWIDDRYKDATLLKTESLRNTATVHLSLCTAALERMRTGLLLLQRDKQIFTAFRFANRAMYLQRSYSEWAREYRLTGKRATLRPFSKVSWRPFQIAFLLLNLRSIAYPDCDERNLVDLLWFPTGGGKTEAYLGLTAFTLGLRRLRGSIDSMQGDGGVTVIMRYTLRLLTTQQFQRATALICACEHIRRQTSNVWGKEPFQIGLWVGSKATPNNLKDAKDALAKLRSGGEVTEGNPMQFSYCPWCGEDLKPSHYYIDDERERMVIACPRKECTFHGAKDNLEKALPVLLIDEDIYHQCPSLLLATIDKFARLPWRPTTMALFGKVNRYCERHGYLVHSDKHEASHRKTVKLSASSLRPCQPFLPPELIIQDELHLISGPLGTLAGLYETAVDLLCVRESKGTLVRPKVIASTATIRRADDQVNGLFAREVCQFPPSGIDAGDSFFASTQALERRPGRIYVGVCAQGRSVKTALVRVYALLLQIAGEQLAQEKKWNADAYATLIGYFNSLRELGGALRLVEDDIVQRVEYLATRNKQIARKINTENCELTSRISPYKIPNILRLLEIPANQPDTIDVLLATNMISVGVDIDRLGLMVVNGQPKTNTEYIQATSRVGRKADVPGLIVTVYNWSRPRDMSHYEGFRPYHQAIYRYVEATSVTPFAPRAQDRALHAVLITLVRLLRDMWTTNESAGRFNATHPLIEQIRSNILQRVGQIDSGNTSEVEAQLRALIDWWTSRAAKEKSALHYQHNYRQPNDTAPILMHPAEEQRSGGSRPTLNSLREVEGESRLFIDWS
jgi:Helicase conserved C-terminal domain